MEYSLEQMDFVAGLCRYRTTPSDSTLALRGAAVMARASRRLVICLDDGGYEVSLERWKLYVALPDAVAARHDRIRVIDESGDDYLYPEERFVEAEFPPATRPAVMRAA